MLGKVRLADQRAALRVEAHREQVEHHLVRQLAHLGPIVDGGHGVVVDDRVDRLVLVLERDVVDLRPEVIAQVRGPGRLDSAEDALADGRLGHRTASVACAGDKPLAGGRSTSGGIMRRMTDPADWSRAADPARRIGHAVEFHAEIGIDQRPRPGGARRARWRGAGRRGRPADRRAAAVGAGPGSRRRERTSSSASPGDLPSRHGSAGLLGGSAALAVRDACAALVPDAGLAIRWPNDVVDGEGRKVAGLWSRRRSKVGS